jgi:HEAT repeat protein
MHRSAVVALESVLGERGMAAGILRNELADPSWRIRLNAVTELGEIGPDAALAIDSLITRLEDPQPSIREAAARVLGSLGPAARAALPEFARRELEWEGEEEDEE